MSKKDAEREGRAIVMDYMLKQNRPFNKEMLFMNLHKAVAKALLQRILDALSDEGKLTRKQFNKTYLYWLSQEGLEVTDAAGLKQKDEDLKELDTELQELDGEVKVLEKEVNRLRKAPTDEALDQMLADQQKENDELKAKVESRKLAAGNSTAASKELVEKKYETMNTEWRKRRRVCNDILGTLEEGTGKSKKVLMEDIGLETDEEYNVVYGQDATSKRRKLAAASVQ